MIDFNQAEDEEVSYKVDTTDWGGTPTNIEVKAFVSSGELTDGVFPTNSPSINGDDINLSPLKNLSAGNVYRITVKFTTGGNVLKKTFRVACN